jgi:hypothetical protein
VDLVSVGKNILNFKRVKFLVKSKNTGGFEGVKYWIEISRFFLGRTRSRFLGEIKRFWLRANLSISILLISILH